MEWIVEPMNNFKDLIPGLNADFLDGINECTCTQGLLFCSCTKGLLVKID